MDLERLFLNWKENAGMFWLWLGIALFLLNLFVVGPLRWEFAYGLTYALGFMAIGLVLSHTDKQGDEATVLGSIFAALIGALAVLVEMTGGTFLAAASGAVISSILFVAVLIFEAGIFGKWGRQSSVKYVTLGAILLWFLWPLPYFWMRYSTYHLPIPTETILYHGGIMLLAFIDLITVAGLVKFDKEDNVRSGLRALFFAVAIIGALLTVGVLGWGLTLAP